MTQKETGAADVTLELLAIQSKAVEAIGTIAVICATRRTQGCRIGAWRRAAAGSAQKPEKATSARRPRPRGGPGGP